MVALRCLARQARDSVCAGIVFVGPVVQLARFGELVKCVKIHRNLSGPVLVLVACRKRVKVGFVAVAAVWRILSSWQKAYFA